MRLFENKTLTVSKIYSVNMYSTEDEFGQKAKVRYDSFLTTHELIFLFPEKITLFSAIKALEMNRIR